MISRLQTLQTNITYAMSFTITVHMENITAPESTKNNDKNLVIRDEMDNGRLENRLISRRLRMGSHFCRIEEQGSNWWAAEQSRADADRQSGGFGHLSDDPLYMEVCSIQWRSKGAVRPEWHFFFNLAVGNIFRFSFFIFFLRGGGNLFDAGVERSRKFRASPGKRKL